jgi:hypothetical protein
MKKLGLFLIAVLCIAFIGQAQTADKYIGKMLSITEDKAYLSFDKPYYTSGEVMYFKAFLTNATSHVPDSLTTVLYVDFIEPETKKVIHQQKLKMQDGHASGSFSTEGVKGSVFIHAYTRWMGNLAADYHFNKSIQVFEAKDPLALLPTPQKTDADTKKRVILPAKKLDVPEVNNEALKAGTTLTSTTSKVVVTPKKSLKNCQFFPESGALLVDFSNRVAFKATDGEGHSIAVKGIIKNQNGDTITEFADTFLGMGRFNLIAKSNEKYTAYIPNEDGSTSNFPLPDAQTKGVVMIVDSKNDTADIRATFYISYDTASMPSSFYLLAHQRGKVCFYNPILVKNKQMLRIFKMTIPRASFNEEGIATLTLFDDKGTPVAERLVYMRNKSRQLNINLTTQKAIFNKRERVTVTIETKTSDGKPIPADLSFAATNDDKITPPQYSEDLRAYLLLRSDLRGHIEQPSYYFEDTTAKARLALDNLLMTQGWRRFKWNEKVDSVMFKSEHGLSVQAIVRNRKTPAENALLVLLLARADDRTQSLFVQTDKKGRFISNNLDFADSAQLYVNITNSTKTYNVEQEQPRTPPSVSEPKIYLPEQPAGNLNTYLEGSQAVLLSEKLRVEKEITLQEFVVKDKKKDPFEGDPRLSNNGFNDHSYIIDDKEQGTVTSFLESRFIKIITTDDGDVVLGHGRGDISGSNYALVIDGYVQFDGRVLMNMFMNDIQRIDINTTGNGGYMTSGNSEGVVHILTKSGDPNYWKKYGNTIKSDVPTLLLKGYTTQKQFYTPDYAVEKPEYAQPDHRTTLYWSPTIKTDATGKATVSFYTTDDKQTARIIVEGIDGTGKVGIAKKTLSVN